MSRRRFHRSFLPQPLSKAARRARPGRLLLALIARFERGWAAWWAARWQALRAWRARRATPPRPMLHPTMFETLEPRLLLSGDLNPAPAMVADPAPVVEHRLAAAPATAAAATAQTATLVLSGPGSGELVAGDDGYVLTLRGTGDATQARIVTAEAGARVTLASVRSEGAVGTLDLSNAMLAGDADLAGSVGSLSLAATGAGRLAVQGSVQQLRITGDSAADVFIAGGGPAALALSTATIGGTVSGGVWAVHGRASAIAAGSTGAAWRLNVTGALAQFTVRGDASGDLAVAALQLLQVGGDARALHLRVGADLGDDAAPGGSGANADRFAAGTLARVRISGSLIDSQLMAGIDPVDGVWGNGNDAVRGSTTNRVQEFVVGGAVERSEVIAPAFPASVRIGGQVLAPASLPAVFAALPADTVAPLLQIALEEDSGARGDDALTRNPALRIDASDAGGVAGFEARLGAAGAFVAVTPAALGSGRWRLDEAALATLAGGTLADGPITVQLRARDAAGNTSAVRTLAFMLDRRVNADAGFGLAAGDALDGDDGRTAAAIVTLRGVAEAGATIEAGALRVQAGGDGAFTLPGIALAEGANLVRLVVTDLAGNTTTLERSITRAAASVTDAVLRWNDVALKAVQRDVTDPPIATRELAMLSLAQYDALAAIDGTPAYLVSLDAGGAADAQAALASAGHRMLSRLYPAQQAVFDAVLAQQIASIPDGAAKDHGLALGMAVADAVWTARADDGSQRFVAYEGSQQVGLWRPTGPMFDVADQPFWRGVTPFALDSAAQFRPAAPPALDTAAYADAVNELKRLGGASGSQRTADQTEAAHFWADGKGSYTPPGHWNLIAEQVAAAKGNSLSANARLFAQLNVALADAAIACWDAKYTYGLWRPETAIQLADQDGNDATAADMAWRPLLITPPHPEYVSGHSTFSRAAATVLAAVFGDNNAFSTTSPTLPGVTRSFASFSEAAAEAGRSRIYGGIHYQFSNAAGAALGTQVAQAVLARFSLADDVQPPSVALDASDAVGAVPPKLAGQVLDNLSGVATLQWRLDGGALRAAAVGADGRFLVQPTLPLDGTADGAHAVTFVARDAAGNERSVTRGFVLDTRAPAVTLASIADGDVVGDTTRLAGQADGTGSALVRLEARIGDGPARTLAFDAATGSFDAALVLGELAPGSHVLTLRAVDAAGHATTLTRRIELAARPPLVITRATPAAGTGEVGVTFRPQVNFSRAVDVATLTADSFYATGPDGEKLAATIVPAMDGSFAWLFFAQPMPGGAVVTLHVDGGLVRAASDGALLDADGDGAAGGVFSSRFTTVATVATAPSTVVQADGTTSVVRTSLVGRVVDPGADLEPMTFDDIRRGPDGVIHTADDVFLNPIAHAKVWVLGQEERFVYTDAQGRFELLDVPAGNVKLAIDGRTATNAPDGIFWPEMVMDLTVEAGQANTVMGSMGTPQEQRANEDRTEVYLPRLQRTMLKDVSDTEDTVIDVDAGAAPQLTEQERAQLKLVVQPGSLVDEHGNVMAGGQVGISTVPPELVRDMLPPGVLQHTFDITIQAPGAAAFNTPLQISFPNVFNAKPGEKLNFLSFDHTTGRLVIEGTATVSADGLSVVTDEGQGITKPGWHGLIQRMFQLAVDAANAVVDSVKDAVAQVKAVIDSPTFQAYARAITNIGDIISSTASFIKKGLPLIGAVIGGVVGNVPGALIGAYAGQVTSATIDVIKDHVKTLYKGFTEGWTREQLYRELDKNSAIYTLRLIPGATFVEDLYKAWNKAPEILQDLKYLRDNMPGLPASEQQRIDDLQNGSHLHTAPPAPTLPALTPEASVSALEDFYEWDGLSDDDRSRLVDTLARMRRDDAYLLPADRDFAAVARSFEEAQRLLALPDPSPEQWAALGENLAFVDANLDAILMYPERRAGDEAQLLGAMAQVQRQLGAALGLTAIPVNASRPVLYVFETADAVLRGTAESLGGIAPAIAPGTNGILTILDRTTGLVARSAIAVPLDGSGRLATQVSFLPSVALDTDEDGLNDDVEAVLGSSPTSADSDGDGVSDRAEFLAGTDPLGGRGLPSGVVGAAALRGEVTAVVLAGSAATGETQTAYVATGSYGLAIVDATQFRTPVVLSQLDLAGTAVDVAVDDGLRIAAVAAGAGGLHLVDVANPAAPRLLQTIAINAAQVEVFEGIAYVATGNELRAYDLATGERLAGVLGGAAFTALARDGDMLYALDGGRTLRAYRIAAGAITARGSLAVAGSPASLFVGGGIAYVGMGNTRTQGYATVDVSDPAALRLVSNPDDATIASGALAANGSGLLVSAGQIVGPSGLLDAVEVINARDAANTGARTTRFLLPEAPRDLAIGGGLAFVAAGSAGLQVVNFLGADTRGNAPTVAADFAALDVDPATPGIQMLEGSTLALQPTVADDVQVRNVELLVNGRVVRNDTGFPFELGTVLPTIAANGGNTTVTLQVRATDTGGNVGRTAAVTVTLVPDTIPPVLVSSNLQDGTTKGRSFRAVTLVYSEPLDPATVTAASLRLVGPGGAVLPAPQLQFRQSGRELQLTFAPLPQAGAYRLEVDAAAVKDRAGNALGSTTVSIAFTVQDYSNEWIGAAGGFWDVAANWSAGRVPTADDDVYIGLPAGASVTVRSGTQAVATLTSDARIAVTGGSLTVAGDARLRAGLRVTGGSVVLPATGAVTGGLQLEGGTLSVGGALDIDTLALAGGTLTGGGSVAVAAASSWSGGTVTGAGTLSFNGDLAVTGAADKVLAGNRVVNLLGTTTWSGATAANTNDFYTGPATINNFGTFVDANAFSTIVRDWYSGDPLVFNNAGTYRKTGAGTSSLELNFNNTGTVDVQAGVLALLRGGSAGAQGELHVEPAATLRFGAGTFTLTDTVFTGTGTVEVAGTFNSSTAVNHGGTSSIAGRLLLTGGTLFANGTLTAATFAQLDTNADLAGTGTLKVTGAATWSDGNTYGTGTTDFAGDLAISGAGDKGINGGRVINLRGTTTWSGATAANTNDFYTGPATINNFGTFVDANAFSTVVRDWYSGDPLVFNNAGTYRKTGAGTSSLELNFNNTGTVDVQAGVLALLRGGSAGAQGELHVEPAATLRFGAGTFTLTDTVFTGTGTVEVAGTFNDSTAVNHKGTSSIAGRLLLTGGTLFAEGSLTAASYAQTANYAFVAGSGTLKVTGAATWSDGNQVGTGTTDFAGDLAISGTGDKGINGGRVINLRGTTTWSGATAANTNDFYTGPATINNFGTFVDANAFSTIVRDWYSGGALVFSNAGTYRKTGGGTTTLEVVFNNTGTVDVQAGTLALTRGGSDTGQGELHVEPAATLRLGGGTFELADTVFTGTGTVEVAGTFNDSTTVNHRGSSSIAGRLLLTGGTLFAEGSLTAASYAQTANYAFVAGSGTLKVTGAATWSDGNQVGTGTTDFAGDLAISGTGDKGINGGRVINLRGTTTWSGATAANTNDFYTGPATINNFGTLVDANAFSTIVRDWYSGDPLVFNNAGIYRKTGGGTTTLEAVFNNTGTLDVQAGVLALTRGGSGNGRSIVAAGTELALTGGVHTWRDGARADVAGTLGVRGDGTLAVEGDVAVSRLALGSGGTLGGAGRLTLTGTGSSWTGGLMSGGGSTRIAEGADLTLSGGARKYLGTRLVDNLGTLLDASTGDLVDLEGAARVRNTGSFELRSDGSWQDYAGAAGSLVIDNSGLLLRSAGTGQFEFLDTALNNTGTVRTTSGQLAFGGSAGTSSGRFETAAGTEIAFIAGTQTWAQGASATGQGTIALRNLNGSTGGSLNVAGSDVSVPRLHLGPLGVLGGAGTLTITGTGSQWTAGTMTGGGTTRIAAGADLTVAGSSRKHLGARTVEVLGRFVEASTGDLMDLDGAARIDNAGTFEIRSDGSWQDYVGAAGTLVLDNRGTLLRSAGTGQFEFLDTALNNTGTVRAETGQLAFGGSGGTSSGRFETAAGTEIAFIAGTQTWAQGAAATGAGAIALRNLNGSTGGTLSVAGSDVTVTRLDLGPLGVLGGNGMLTITGTGSQWTAGAMNGGGTTRIAAGADFTMSGSARKFLGSRTVLNLGTFTEASTGGLLDYDGAAVFDNRGLLDIRATTSWRNFSGAAGTLTLANSGTVRKSAGAGDFLLYNTVWRNTGVLEVLVGRLLLDGVPL